MKDQQFFVSGMAMETYESLLRRATDLDNGGLVEDAVDLYKQGLEKAAKALETEANNNSKLVQLIDAYKRRLAYLEAALARQGSNSNSTKKPQISRDRPNVRWSDIVGAKEAKDALIEAIELPSQFPHWFVGRRRPWKAILLYGPPGTGKTQLARAAATQTKANFFSISSSDIMSKWVGESERTLTKLFKQARDHAPSIIFIDEIDSLASARCENESESACRVKTQLMVEMEGVDSLTSDIIIVGATNRPWELDAAIRRRLEKRIFVGLPTAKDRATMLRLGFADTPHSISEEEFQVLGQRSAGFSGSDIDIVIKEVLMAQVREIMMAERFKHDAAAGTLLPCEEDDANRACVRKRYRDIIASDPTLAAQVTLRDVTFDNLAKVLDTAKPTVSPEDLQQLMVYAQEFGG